MSVTLEPCPAPVPVAAVPTTTVQRPSPFVPSTRGRPSWSGMLRASLVTVPVKAYAAVSTAATAHFHLLHAGCNQRITYQKHCPGHGAVTADAIVRGYAYAPAQHVIVEAEELERLRPARDKALLVEQFVGLG